MLNNVNVEITLPTTGRIEIGDLYVKINEAALVAAKAIGQAILSNTLLLLLNEKRISLTVAIRLVAIPAITAGFLVAK